MWKYRLTQLGRACWRKAIIDCANPVETENFTLVPGFGASVARYIADTTGGHVVNGRDPHTVFNLVDRARRGRSDVYAQPVPSANGRSISVAIDKMRAMREDDLPALFEIQLDETARQQAAFVGAGAQDRDAYLRKGCEILADAAIVMVVEVTYWIRRDCWGQGVASAALAAFLKQVPVRPLHGRVVQDNLGSIRVLERNGFVRTGSAESFAHKRQQTVTELIFRLD